MGLLPGSGSFWFFVHAGPDTDFHCCSQQPRRVCVLLGSRKSGSVHSWICDGHICFVETDQPCERGIFCCDGKESPSNTYRHRGEARSLAGRENIT